MRSETWARRVGVLALALAALPAPLLATTANDLCMPTANPCVVSTTVAVTDDSIIDVGARELRIANGGALNVGGGTMTLQAATLTISAGGFVRALGTGSTPGGAIAIQVGDLTVTGGLEANGAPGGSIAIAATGAVAATGPISARSLAREDLAGNIDIVAATATLGGQISLLGGFDAVGGDLSIDTTGDLNITGELIADGGDGGGIDIRVGRPTSGANLVIGGTAELRADNTTVGGFAGAIDILIEGDGINNGSTTIDGQLSANGVPGSLELGGGSGGCVEVQATGEVLIMRSARLSADGGAPDGDGGEIDITSLNGPVTLEGTATASVGGEQSNGGAVTIDARGNSTISGSILATAGDGGGGEVAVSSTAASVIVSRTATIDVSSMVAGLGGGICLESGVGEGTHTLTIEGRLSADGGSGGGAGGGIDLVGGDSVRIGPTAILRAAGAAGGGGGGGGTVSVRADPGIALIEGPITATGGSPSGAGGVVAIDAVGRINVPADVDTEGFGPGGQIGIATDTGPVDIFGDLTAGSRNATGGSIEVTAQSDVRLAGEMVTDGSAAPGGRIEIVGCAVTLCGLDSPACPAGGDGVMSSLGPSGINRITGRDSSAVLGTMRANNNTGRNELVYDGQASREPLVLGDVRPAASLLVDPSVLPCPFCGNRSIEPPETCDDGNQLDGDGCSSSCQTEDVVPGDANGDRVVSADDIGYTIQEIFDGDGDSVSMVSGGGFPGAPGADSNGDDVVSAADLSATIELVVAQ
jgi:cysteine-rich repeat protein